MRGEHGVKFRPMADDHVVRTWLQVAPEAAVVAVVHVLHGVLAAVRAEVGAGRAVAADELHLAGDRPALLVGDPGHDGRGLGQLDRERLGDRRRASETSFEPRPMAETGSEPGSSPAVERQLPVRRRCDPRLAACRLCTSATSASATVDPPCLSP